MREKKQRKGSEKRRLQRENWYKILFVPIKFGLLIALQLRESRKADLEKHVAEINSMLQREADPDPVNLGEENRPNGGDNQEQSDGTMEHLNADLEAKYLDEDRYTTVTVEAVDVSRDGLHKVAHDEVDESDGEGLKESSPKVMLADRRRNPGEKRLPSKVKSVHKKKKRKFRYESKAERKTTRHKERSKNSAKARDRKS